MNPVVKIFDSPDELAESLVTDLLDQINARVTREGFFSLAVSGGNTPRLFFQKLADRAIDSVVWKKVHFFWVDERCVPPFDKESNFGMTRESLLDRISIPVCNIHRIRGEDDPGKEAVRYSDELKEVLPTKNGLPHFDMIILGLGEDGHTASIFPGNEDLFHSDRLSASAVNPSTGQKRITLTGRIINNADIVIFMVTGYNKAGIIRKILSHNDNDIRLPASFVNPDPGKLFWYTDRDAGQFLESKD
jgi:6-phosphogluconolactonase